MNTIRWSFFLLLAIPLVLTGCGRGPNPPDQGPPGTKAAAHAPEPEEADIKEARAKLSPEDRRLVEQQEFCAVAGKSRLGSMGVPYKLEVKGRPVFLCCDGCERRALADPDKTLAQVERLKQQTKGVPAGQ